MEYAQLIRKVFRKNAGTFAGVKWGRELKTLKSAGEVTVVKVSDAQIQIGVSYANAAKRGRIPGREADMPVQERKWGTYIEGMYPYFVEHKGQKYMNLYLKDPTKIESHYFLNGKEVDKSVVKPLCLKSEFPESGELPKFITVKIENIMELRQK